MMISCSCYVVSTLHEEDFEEMHNLKKYQPFQVHCI